MTPQTSGQLWSGTATLSGTTASTTFADLGSVSGTVTQVSSTNLSCVAATSLVGITCTPATAGVFEISTSGYITNTGNNQTYNQVTDGSGNVLGGLQNNTITAAGNATSLSSTVQYVAASTGPFTIKWQGKNNGGTNTHYLTSASVRLVSQSIPAPILQNQVSTSAAGGSAINTTVSSLAFTPSAGFGTVSSQSWITKRVGDTLVVRGRIYCGTPGASVASIALPAGYTIDATKLWSGLTNTVGSYTDLSASSGHPAPLPMWVNSGDLSTVYFGYTASSSAYTNVNVNTLFDAGDNITVNFEIPIAGWN